MLELCSANNIPLGVEMSGWTLKQINSTDREWVSTFRNLIREKKCELIGSGYCQIIAPLVPYQVNIANHKIGLDCYKEFLNVIPSVALVNEMAFSNSVVDILSETGYRGFVMDRSNVQLAIGTERNLRRTKNVYAKGNQSTSLPVIWADTLLFQKLQHVSHGDISISDYLDYIEYRMESDELPLSLYCNDAETFNFRPGRFSGERKINPKGEWHVMAEVMHALKEQYQFRYILPSEVLPKSGNERSKEELFFSSASYPIPVKKQPKYNIARWSVTGRDDPWLNVLCYRIFNHLVKSGNDKLNHWRDLCEFWASDYRTHLTNERWEDLKRKLLKKLEELNLSASFGVLQSKKQSVEKSLETVLKEYTICKSADGIYLNISNQKIDLTLNLRRGLAIESLIFETHELEPCLGTLKHGYSYNIENAADFYSGGVILERPDLRAKFTDLHPVEPNLRAGEAGELRICSVTKTKVGKFLKIISIFPKSEKIYLSYEFVKMRKEISSLRVGNITFSKSFSQKMRSYSCHTGGSDQSSFFIDSCFKQSIAASSFVSSSMGFFTTSGNLDFDFCDKKLFFQWDITDSAPLCLLDHHNDYSRVSFSLSEIDDTSCQSDTYSSFKIGISPINILSA